MIKIIVLIKQTKSDIDCGKKTNLVHCVKMLYIRIYYFLFILFNFDTCLVNIPSKVVLLGIMNRLTYKAYFFMQM